MKVDNLLGPYLYQHKKLSLPGIGVFTLDDKAILPDETAKIKTAIEGISFSAITGQQLDDSLIQYIKDQTGKMKALAEADLYSYIATAFQYLNIGKPFYFEGIGTLQKNKDNGYAFAAGTVIPQKTEDIPHKHIETKRKSVSAYGHADTTGGGGFNTGKLLVPIAVLVTLALIGWGGYYLYNKNTVEPEQPAQNVVAPVVLPENPDALAIDSTGKKPDSVSMQPATDSTAAKAASKTTQAIPGNGYKFVFETTAKKARADKRYEQLKGIGILKEYNNKVAIETNDSLSFKIYTLVPCTPADTARVKELLNAWYYGKADMKVKIEQ
ncbi:MAG: hypothetical protein ABIU63_11045 [Chitinophagaceae bacterium]